MTATDEIALVKGFLTDNWTPANTDSVTPTISEIWEFKRVDVCSGDFVLLYQSGSSEIETSSIGTLGKHQTWRVSIDIRTSEKAGGRTHLIKLKNEVERIISNKIVTADSNFQFIEPISYMDFTNKMHDLYRMVLDVKIESWKLRPT